MRSTCLSINLNSFSTNGCRLNNWLAPDVNVLTILPNSSESCMIFNINTQPNLSGANAYISRSVWPVIYLKTNTKIINGEGTKQSLFILSIQTD